MIKRTRLFLAALLVAAAGIAGCVQSAVEPEGGGEEAVGSARQAIIQSGYFRTYYSDSTYTDVVGTFNYDCDPNYRFQEGDTSNYYEDYRYDCPGYDDPTLPECDQCVIWTQSGQSQKSCYVEQCTTPPPW